MKTALSDAGVTMSSNNREHIEKHFAVSIETEEGGLEGFLRKLKQPTLEEFVKLLDFETDATAKDQFSYDIADEVLLLGTRLLVEKVPAATLKEALKIINKKVTGKKTELEDRLLNEAFPGIVEEEAPKTPSKKEKSATTPTSKESKKGRTTKNSTGEDYIPPESTEKTPKKAKKSKEETPSKSPAMKNAEIIQNRKPLEKGITYEDVFQGYWADELKDFCRKHNLKASGNKKELIRRILDWFDHPDHKGYTEKKKRKKKQNEGGNKKQKVDKEDTASTKPEENGDDAEKKEDQEMKEENKPENNTENKSEGEAESKTEEKAAEAAPKNTEETKVEATSTEAAK
jgi:hypothetical protein